MSDYQVEPAYRERNRRRVRYRLSTWQQLVQVAIVAFGAVAMAAALILLLGVLMSLVGSAAGQAAVQAASETSSRATQINQLR